MTGRAAPPPLATVYARRGEIVTREIAGETVLVPIRGGLADLRRIFSLNATGACVWALLDGRRTVGAILDGVVERFDVGRDRAARDVAAFLAAAEDAGLLEATPPEPA